MHPSTAMFLAAATPAASSNGATAWVTQVVVPLLTAFLAFAGVWYQSRRKRVGQVKAIDQAVEIYNALPEVAKSRDKLVEHIDTLVMDLVLARSKHRRDSFGASLAVIFVAVGVWLAYLANSGGWSNALWVPAAFFLIFGIPGFFESIAKKDRDASGSRRGSKTPETQPPPAGKPNATNSPN